MLYGDPAVIPSTVVIVNSTALATAKAATARNALLICILNRGSAQARVSLLNILEMVERDRTRLECDGIITYMRNVFWWIEGCIYMEKAVSSTCSDRGVDW